MSSAVVLFSGGLDSTAALLWAIDRYGLNQVETVSFDYGQPHRCELESVKRITEKLRVPNQCLSLEAFSQFVPAGLLANTDASKQSGASAFIPGRNLFFVINAAVYAYNCGATHLVAGFCAEDQRDFPDCRATLLDPLQKTLAIAMDTPFELHAPMISKTKAQIIEWIDHHGAFDLLALTHTCYAGQRPGCGDCAACRLRQKGFTTVNKHDPISALV